MTATPLSTLGMLEKLVGFDSTSRNSNLPIIDFIADYLDGLGIQSITVDYEKDNKTNLYATIGPDGPGGVVLSGHTDVVPVDGQDWSSDPFVLTRGEDAVFGRGTCDMKGFVAVCLAHAHKFAAADLKRPIHFAFSCDEEVGCTGVRPLIGHIIEHLPQPAAVIVGEPTMMHVVNAHKGGARFATTITGHEAHSSCPHLGVNAILVAGELLGEISRMADEYRELGDPTGRFDPPYTTFQVGKISGGTGNNIIPRQCQFTWETRTLPHHDPAEILARFERFAQSLEPAMKDISTEAGISTTNDNEVPALKPFAESLVEQLALNLTRTNETQAVSYGTEGGLFQSAGMDTIICGPGSIEQAHKPDEFISLAQLKSCETFMDRLTEHCVAGGT